MTTIAYLVHDTSDAAVARRVRMFRAGGAEVRLGGFNRHGAPREVAGVPVTDMGRTADARLAARAVSVGKLLLRPGTARALVDGADVIVARNLEMLAVAVRVARAGQRIVFECLDIHRLLLSDGAAGRGLRALERRLLARVDLILTSSPAFEHAYFRARQRVTTPMRVEENRLLLLGGDTATPVRTEACVPPVRIGWFGMLRCARSLAILRSLALSHPGRVEVLIAGVPSYTEFADFDRDVANVPGLSFVGRYTADDLPRLYGAVDFAWAIDYFEEGQNSTWLLPNRLYESLALGGVPVALADVETGRWLAREGVGITLADPATEMGTLVDTLTTGRLAGLREQVDALPRARVVADEAACRDLTAAIA